MSRRIPIKPKSTSIMTMGGISKELAVASDLSKQGFEIYTPSGPYSGVDFVAIKNDLIELVEVKTGIVQKDGRVTCGRLSNDRPTLLAMVDKDYKIYYFPR